MAESEEKNKKSLEEKRNALLDTGKKEQKPKPSRKEEVFHTLKYVEDVPQYLQVEIARKELKLRDVINWKSGSVVDFPKIIGEPMEVLIGDRLIARGEIVVVNERYGIRISEITRPDEKPGELRK
ncbi:FliM/FliN family flagellar motor switch protein [Deltaproteobacteria bacterium TL4]